MWILFLVHLPFPTSTFSLFLGTQLFGYQKVAILTKLISLFTIFRRIHSLTFTWNATILLEKRVVNISDDSVTNLLRPNFLEYMGRDWGGQISRVFPNLLSQGIQAIPMAHAGRLLSLEIGPWSHSLKIYGSRFLYHGAFLIPVCGPCLCHSTIVCVFLVSTQFWSPKFCFWSGIWRGFVWGWNITYREMTDSRHDF